MFRESLVGVMTPRTACFGVRIPVGARDISLLPNVQTVSEAHLSSNLSGTGILSREKGGMNVKLTMHLPLYRE